MPDTEIMYDAQGNEIESTTIQEIRQAQREADKRAKAAEARARGAELKVAMAEAGVTLNPRTKFFLEHYEGETDAESVKAGLAEHGFVEEPKEDPKTETAAQAQEEASAASAGGEDPGPGEDGHIVELRELYENSDVRSDPYKLNEKAQEIMRRHGQQLAPGQ